MIFMTYRNMKVYIANLGKYAEGELIGDWFTFPIDKKDVAERIGLNERYEEYAIHDTYNCPMEIEEYTTIEELNRMYEMMQDFPEEVLDNLEEFRCYFGSVEEVAENLDRIVFYPDCETMKDVAYYFVHELQALGDIPPAIEPYIDFEAYGRTLEINGHFIETNDGMCEITRR